MLMKLRKNPTLKNAKAAVLTALRDEYSYIDISRYEPDADYPSAVENRAEWERLAEVAVRAVLSSTLIDAAQTLLDLTAGDINRPDLNEARKALRAALADARPDDTAHRIGQPAHEAADIIRDTGA